MNPHAPDSRRGLPDEYLTGRGQAWFAFVMTIGLMLVDYVDRQVIVSLFPYMKTDWGLSDKQLGALVSVVSVTVALGALPVALLADRYSRVKSIVVMATVWSLATISCMFTRNYAQLLGARAFVGLGEAGYGSVGAALISSVFPARMRSMLLAAFFAAASIGSVLGVMLGGLIAARWGWKAAFGVVGFPGLLLALLYLKVRDYRTVDLTPELNQATRSTGSTVSFVARALVRSPTMLWVCLGGAAQLIVVSAIWSWLPSFLNRFHGVAPDQSAIKAALVVLCGALGSVVWGIVADRAGEKRPRNKLIAMGVLCVLALAAGADAVRADRSRRLPDDLYGWACVGGRDRRRAPRRARHRCLRAGAVPEPVRPGGRSVRHRRAVGRARTSDGAHHHPCLRSAGGVLLRARGAQL
jgi:MFS family permease